MPADDRFFEACADGDIAALEALLASEPALVHARDAQQRTGLHLAVRHPHALRLLLACGADPNAREAGDNVSALHLAAAQALVESATALLDAGADVHGEGDLHEAGVIGWASGARDRAIVDLLVARGGRHHVFSAMALRDRDLVRRVVADNPSALQRRRSRFENRQTAVHASFAAPDGVGYLTGTPDYDMLSLLIDLGADIEATDDRGRTPMAVAMLRGDVEAMRRLAAAGARVPPQDASSASTGLDARADAVLAGEPMFGARDIGGAVHWYKGLGFTPTHAYEDDGALTFARLALGTCAFALTVGDDVPRGVSLWVMTSDAEAMYAIVRARQLDAARRALANEGDVVQYPFAEDLYTPCYGGRQFSLCSPHGLSVIFYQPGEID